MLRSYKLTGKFPEAFERYRRKVDTSKIKDFEQLKNSFRYWQKENRITLSRRQITGLAQEGTKKLGIKAVRQVTIIRYGKSRIAYRDIGTGRFAKKPETN